MTLYITNTTKQELQFHYRTLAMKEPGRAAPFITIPSGRQKELGEGWSEADTNHVIRQLERYGARDAAEAHGALKTFHGILYRVGGIIDASEIEMGHDAVVDTQEKRSVREAQRSALGFDRAVQALGRGGKRAAKQTAVEVIERGDPRERPTGNEVAFTQIVDPEGGDLKLAG